VGGIAVGGVGVVAGRGGGGVAVGDGGDAVGAVAIAVKATLPVAGASCHAPSSAPCHVANAYHAPVGSVAAIVRLALTVSC